MTGVIDYLSDGERTFAIGSYACTFSRFDDQANNRKQKTVTSRFRLAK